MNKYNNNNNNGLAVSTVIKQHCHSSNYDDCVKTANKHAYLPLLVMLVTKTVMAVYLFSIFLNHLSAFAA
jgi:hypothetical protein